MPSASPQLSKARELSNSLITRSSIFQLNMTRLLLLASLAILGARASSLNIFFEAQEEIASNEIPKLRTVEDDPTLALFEQLLANSSSTSPFITQFGRGYEHPTYNGSDVGEPLILTPMIEAGKVKEAQLASKVRLKGNTGIMSQFSD